MIAIFLTHADARSVPWKTFRALTESGRDQIHETAKRFRDIADHIIPDWISGDLTVGEVLTSPAARCIESALLFADLIRDRVSTTEIRIRDRLREKREGQLSAGYLVSILDDTTSPVVLVCTHGDLAGALPTDVMIKAKYNDKGWFNKARPALAVVQYEREAKWTDAKLLMCAAIVEGKWSSLVDDGGAA